MREITRAYWEEKYGLISSWCDPKWHDNNYIPASFRIKAGSRNFCCCRAHLADAVDWLRYTSMGRTPVNFRIVKEYTVPSFELDYVYWELMDKAFEDMAKKFGVG
jgi:hypothetical protein